jgi:hypothetical protein
VYQKIVPESEIVSQRGLASADSGEKPLLGCLEHSCKLSDTIKGGHMFEQLNDDQSLNMVSSP